MGLQRTAGRLTDPRAGRAAMTADATSHKSIILIEVTCVRYLKDDLSRFAKAGSAAALVPRSDHEKVSVISGLSHTHRETRGASSTRATHTGKGHPDRHTHAGAPLTASRPSTRPRAARSLSLSLPRVSLIIIIMAIAMAVYSPAGAAEGRIQSASNMYTDMCGMLWRLVVAMVAVRRSSRRAAHSSSLVVPRCHPAHVEPPRTRRALLQLSPNMAHERATAGWPRGSLERARPAVARPQNMVWCRLARGGSAVG